MKKTLYSTTVLAAAGLLTLGASDAFAQAAAPAAPEKLKLTLGGFMNQYVTYVDQDGAGQTGGKPKSFDQKSDSEVYFTGSVKLDNGITASVVVQLETDQGTTEMIDESYMRLDTDFGQFRLGQTDPAAAALQVEAPFVGINTTNGDMAAFINNPTGNVAGVGGSTIGGGDPNRVYYITPAFFGFRGGASYAPSTTSNNQLQPIASEAEQTDLSAQWAGAVGDFALRASAAYWWNNGTNSATTSGSNRNLAFGGDVTFADFTLGAGWRRQSAYAGDTSGADATSWNVGLAYKPGPWSAAISYYAAEAEGSRANPNVDEVDRLILAATYSIGPGVNLLAEVLFHKYQDEADVVSNENYGKAVIGGITIAF